MVALEAAFITGVATAFGAPLVNHWLHQLGFNCPWLSDIHKELNDELDWLLALQRAKDDEALSAKQKDTSLLYKHWMVKVSKIKREVNYLNEEYKKVSKMNFLQSWDLKKRIEEARKEVNYLYSEKCPKEILIGYVRLERVIEEAGVKSSVKYPTFDEAFENIRTLLKDKQVKCVALHGQRGVGKTTIMKRLNNHHFRDSSDNREFDMVIFIKVATDEQAEFLHILQKIADRIKEDREGDESEVTERIRRVLKNKRYLLILDGIRHKPDGILEKLDISQDIKDSKVVITPHNHLHLLNTKCVDRTVELKLLKPKEEWDMFRDIVGDKLLSQDIPKARQVCKRSCCRLPLLIYHIASSFARVACPNWQKALDELTPWPKVGVEGLAQLYQHLKISYDLLGRCKQLSFLYVSLHPANRNIYTHYLVECCIVQRFLGGVEEDTRYNGYNILRTRSHTILRDLIDDKFLEEEGEQMRYVKMNDFYWQLASYILSEDPRQHVKWFSRIGSESDDLPTNQNCLQALLLQRNLKLVGFPSKGFDSMGNLLILNLYHTKISMLPSLEKVAKLKAFYLNGCSELEIGQNEIEPLKELEIFDIRDTKVNFVPCLKSLRCLRISCIATGNYRGFSMLQKLEELTIKVNSPEKWDADAQCIIGEVASLQYLTTLRCSFQSSPILEEFLEARQARLKRTRSLPIKFS